MNRLAMMAIGAVPVIAIIIALIMQMRAPPKPKVEAAPPVVAEILIANKPLATGSKMKPDDVSWHAWPENGFYKGTFKKADEPDIKKLAIFNAPLRRDIEAGEPITSQSVVTDAKGTFLSALLAPGMRAAAIGVGATTGAGGFISPGDYVDVVLTYTPRISGAGQEYLPQFAEKIASQLILSNVKVLAVDQDSKDERHEAKLARTVTLEVSLENASKLAIAEQMGTLYIYLRRLGEQDNENAPPLPLVSDVTTSDIIKQSRTLSDRAKSSQQTGEVRIYNGSDVSNMPVRQSAPQQ